MSSHSKKIMKKVALVTGASSGIGKETAKLLIENGYIVYGASRRIEKMIELKEFGVQLVELDIADDNSIVRCVEEVLRN